MSSTDVQNARDWNEQLHEGTNDIDPLTEAVRGIEDSNLDWIDKRVNDDLPGGTPADSGLSPAERVASKQFETREQDYDRMARAAGVKRTGSDADLLGFSSPRRRVGLARRLVGG